MRGGATSSIHRLIMGKRTSINKCHYLAQPFDVLSLVDLFSFFARHDNGGRLGGKTIHKSVHE